MSAKSLKETPLPRMSTPRYVPKVGDVITVELPDERTRAEIERVVSDETVIAKIIQFTTSRSHSYRKGESIPCRFEMLGMTIRGWRAVSQRELDDADAAAKAKKEK